MRLRLPAETYDSEPPPVLGSWRAVYTVVLGWLAVLIGLFAIFTLYFR